MKKTRKGVTALVDLDPMVYAAGFASEEHHYILNWRDVSPDHLGEMEWDTDRFARFQSAWRRDAFIESVNLHPDEYVSHMHVIPRPVSHALHIVNDWMTRIRLACEGFLAEHDLELVGVQGYLTGKSNFRNQVATIKPYKGNRDPSKRPYWYKEIRTHLIQHHNAIVSKGYEADDAMAMRQWAQDQDAPQTIICTIDKDLKMVPGLHYNYGKMTSSHLGWNDALLNFWRQVLTGDPSDNIPGLFKVGPATAVKLLPKYTTEKEMYHVVLHAYEANMAKYPEHHAPHTSPVASLTENARLLWMLTHEDDLWFPPGAIDPPSLSEYLAERTPVDPDEDWL